MLAQEVGTPMQGSRTVDVTVTGLGVTINGSNFGLPVMLGSAQVLTGSTRFFSQGEDNMASTTDGTPCSPR